jgi:hypothetical protein
MGDSGRNSRKFGAKCRFGGFGRQSRASQTGEWRAQALGRLVNARTDTHGGTPNPLALADRSRSTTLTLCRM